MSTQYRAEWVEESPCLWRWGDWYISRRANGYHLIVSSGVEYGPFLSFSDAKQHAEDVRAD